MGYYMGDYYGRPHMYRGDPGFFGTIGNIFKGVASSLVGTVPVIGGALSKGIESIGAKQAPKLLTSGGSEIVAAGKSALKKVGSVASAHPVLTGIGAAGLAAAAGGAVGSHLARRAAAGGARKRRRMNPCNHRALKRAIRRAHGFEKLAKSVIGFSSPRKPKGHMYFKRRRKK